jgi:hypothetical protein
MMRQGAKSSRSALLWGSVFNLLAAVLLVLAPEIQALHLSTCSNHHHGISHGLAILQSHDAGTLAEGSPASGVSSFSGHDHAADHCPICQALRALGQHFTLPKVATLDRLAVTTATAPPESHGLLFPLLKYSISPRAPPFVLT